MGLRSLGYPIVSQSTITVYMARYLATAEGMATAEQFAAAGIQSYFIANPIEGTIAENVAAYLQENPPANGQNATEEQVQEAVDAYFALYPPQPGPQGVPGPVGPAGQSITQAQLAAAVAAYLQANPPQPGAQGPAGQNATDEQVAQAVSTYLTNNPLNQLVNTAVANYFAQNPQPQPATATPLADSGTGVVGASSRYAREDHRHPVVGAASPANAAPPGIAAANAQGSSPNYARQDHTHAHLGVICRDAKTGLTTNNSGVWTKTYPANFWTAAPSINAQPRMASGNYVPRVQTTGSVGAGFTVTVTFAQLASSVSILVLGTVSLTIAAGTVTFDYQAFEPNAV